MASITCARCGQTRDQMPFRPFPNDVGLKVFESICNVCWQEWLATQKQIINHYSLDPREPKSREVLYTHMDTFLFGPRGLPTA
ncbi:MAG: oxidative damage protection protein [Gemmatimonadota bacterium]